MREEFTIMQTQVLPPDDDSNNSEEFLKTHKLFTSNQARLYCGQLNRTYSAEVQLEVALSDFVHQICRIFFTGVLKMFFLL